VTVPAWLQEYAEWPDRFAYVPERSIVERMADERVCILQGATWASISGVRVDSAAVAGLLAEVRQLVPPEMEPTWWVGPSSRPVDLVQRLVDLGLRTPRDRAPLVRGLVTTTPRPAAPADVRVVQISTFEEFRAAKHLAWDAFGTPAARRARQQARAAEEFDHLVRSDSQVGFLALVDGRAAGTAMALPSDRGVFLKGGATAAWVRGRGVYRALVQARWNYAVERGTPALVTHAVPDTSYPTLRRLGFQDVCTIHRLEDPAG
jgi:GNAT superfamily N-acetyltransferase